MVSASPASSQQLVLQQLFFFFFETFCKGSPSVWVMLGKSHMHGSGDTRVDVGGQTPSWGEHLKLVHALSVPARVVWYLP